MLSAPATASPVRLALEAAHDLDLLDQLGRDAVDEERAVGAGAGHLLAVDQDLGVARVEAAQARAVVFDHVGQERDAGHALEHVAGGQRLEALEVLQVVDQHRRGVVAAVAVDDLALYDDGAELVRLLRHRRLLGGGAAALVRASRRVLRESRRGDEQNGGREGVRDGEGEMALLHACDFLEGEAEH